MGAEFKMTMQTEPISQSTHIRLVDVYKVYPLGDSQMTAVHGVSLKISKGAFASIAGASGSGKTTLLNLIGGLDKVTNGEVHVGGQKLDDLTDTELAAYRRTKLGFVFQNFNLIPV